MAATVPWYERRACVWAALTALTIAYLAGYLIHPASPINAALKQSWWNWSDQIHYLQSAVAFSRGDLAPSEHWYPLGYPLLAAPFAALSAKYAFFLVDLAGLLAAAIGYLAFARRFGVSVPAICVLFVLPVATYPKLAEIWVVPWNSTPTAGLIWLLLAMTASYMFEPVPNAWRAAAMGLVAMSIAAIRPNDGVFAAIFGVVALAHAVTHRRLRGRDAAAAIAGAVLVACAYGALHLGIYGWHKTAYMTQERDRLFLFHDLPFKAFVLLFDPRAWFGDGIGIMQHLPWLALTGAGALSAPFIFRGPARWAACMLAAALAMHFVVYLSYVELVPTGLDRYDNVHYFKWAFPGCSLLAWLWLRQFWSKERPRRLAAPLAAFGIVVLLMLPRLEPVPASATEEARLLIFGNTRVDWFAGYVLDSRLADLRGTMRNHDDMHLIPERDRLRVVALRRLFDGPVRWIAAPPGVDPKIMPRRYRERVTLGWPCALPPYPCGATPESR